MLENLNFRASLVLSLHYSQRGEFCASDDKASMELNKKASFWAQRCSEIS